VVAEEAFIVWRGQYFPLDVNLNFLKLFIPRSTRLGSQRETRYDNQIELFGQKSFAIRAALLH
jgi:hypothetical protein